MQFKKEKEENFKWGVMYLFMPLEKIYIYYVVMQAIFLTLIYLIVVAYERELLCIHATNISYHFDSKK